MRLKWPRSAEVNYAHAARQAYIGLGGNLGPAGETLRAAWAALSARPGVQARLRPGARQIVLPAFIEATPFVASRPRAGTEVPVLLAVGMMRTRDKLDSYRVLARALDHLKDRPWQAVLVGDGPARGEIETLMKPFGTKVRFVGAVERSALPALYAAADLYVWPAINEAFGIAFLEAQASGLPVGQCDVYKLMLGGGFGRRGRADYVRQAVLVAKE